MAFPDAELVMMQYLSQFGWTVTSTPADLSTRLAEAPVIRVQRVGGGATERTDSPRVSVQPFVLASSADPRTAQRVANDIRDFLLSTDGAWVSGDLLEAGALIDSVSNDSGPVEYPWPDPAIRVTQSIYTVHIRL